MTPFRDTALALLEAESRKNQAQALREGLLEVPPNFLVDFVTVIVGVLAFNGDSSPRTIYDGLFAGCPSDEDWERMCDRWREEEL